MTPRLALTALAPPYRYRAVLDADGWPIIPGRPGRLGWHGAELVVYMERSRLLDGPGRCRGSEAGAGLATRRGGLLSPEVLPATFCTACR